jgi:predicted Zn-dependent peptidase
MRVRRRPLVRSGLALIFILVASLLLQAQSFEALKSKVKVHVLTNGMTFIVLERHDAPVVSFHVYADVGSANESYGITGISHVLEHMAFKGSQTVGTTDFAGESKVLAELDAANAELAAEQSKPLPDPARVEALKKRFDELEAKAKTFVVNNEFFDSMLRQGDAGVNAYTNTDATQYIDSLPSNKVEFWMAMTSDRFFHPVFREFYKELSVIREERRLGIETQPTGRLVEDFLAAAFKASPYHHQVIGHMSDLMSINRRDVEDYFKKFYSPSNLTASIVGDVKPEDVFRLADLYFGRIPSGPKPEPVRTREPEQWGERRVSVEAMSMPIILMGYHRPEASHKDIPALDALADILSQGRSSRLFQSLVKDKKAAVAVQSLNGFPGRKYPSLLAFVAVPAAGRTSEECLKLIDEGIEKIKTESVTADELTKFKRTAVKNILDEMQSNSSLAAMLIESAVVMGAWQKAFDRVDAIKAITAEDVKRVANSYLVRKNRTIAEIVPAR